MSIKIPVSASLDTGDVEQQIEAFRRKLNSLGQQIAQANKAQFNPIGKTTLQDLQRVVQQFEALKRVSGDLNRRLTATGQGNAGFLDVDWHKLYPDAASRSRQMAKAFRYVTGASFQAPASSTPSAPPAPGAHAPAGGGLASVAGGVAQVGLRAASGATGGVGGVAANALGNGMSAGFGAGLMGLLGGLGALGVGKIVGAATENIDKAEQNAVAFDKLKRTLGDVNVSFAALKAAISGAADRSGLGYGETIGLAQQFAKLGNVPASQYKGLPGELGMGIGISRAYGLDPSEGVGMLGRMRGVGVTRNEQDTRRFALLIGETIGKAGAFAKADEAMEAIAGFAEAQTRNNLGRANVEGYSGMFAGLVGSGIPGLDPTGANNMLAQANANLQRGGAKGEASQFFTGIVGNRLGLDPIQTQILREGGAFATTEEAFGADSVATRFGIAQPKSLSKTTFLQATLDTLRGAYGHNRGLLAQATANHLGLNMRQAMGLLSVNPQSIGEMQKYADLSKLSGNGIGNLSKALYGSSADRASLADSLRRRTGDDQLSPAELAKLDKAMKGGDAEQKRVLAELVATRDQERTQGSDIRDSKNALENIKTSIADKLVPLTQEMRHGIMAIAGGGKKGPDAIMREVLEMESKDLAAAISGKFNGLITPLEEKRDSLKARTQASEESIRFTYRDRPDVLQAKLAERRHNLEELAKVERQINGLEREKAEQLKKENARRDEEIRAMQKASQDRWAAEQAAKEAEEKRRKVLEEGGGAGSGAGGKSIRYGGRSGAGGASKAMIDGAMKFFMDKGWSREQAAGIVANLDAESTMRHDVVGDGGQAYGLAQWHPDRQAAFKRWSGKDIRQATREEQLAFVHHELTAGEDVGARRAGRLLKGARGAGHAADIVTRHYERPLHVDRDAADRAARAERIGTPMPAEAAEAERRRREEMRIRADPLAVNVTVADARGRPIAPQQRLNTRVQVAQPFGAG
ncbi:phage tail tip lysozyme [Gulbenkiania mobilis]|uniref:phage tail tip lysozyme n=1 Tax=Gulbenkiania mobilis TaxID=397457 RepID=UPI0006BBAF64|nr:phage tail tip lysozyme [Gulbenkiania mobilis]